MYHTYLLIHVHQITIKALSIGTDRSEQANNAGPDHTAEPYAILSASFLVLLHCKTELFHFLGQLQYLF